MTTSGERWLASRYTGIFSAFDRVEPLAHDPDIFLYAATIARRGPQTEALVVGGAGFTEEGARLACVGEAIERFQSYPEPWEEGITASFATFPRGDRAVPPSSWMLFHPEQYSAEGFPFARFDDNRIVRWQCFRSAQDGAPVWIPEDLSALHARPGASHGIAPMTSTGIVAGREGDPILLRGLQEVIERDALVAGWWGTYFIESPPTERVFAILGREIEERAARPGLRFRFYRIRSPFSDHVTMAAVEGDDRDGYCFSVGSACRAGRVESFRKSLLEALQGRHYARYRKAEQKRTGQKPPRLPYDFASHALHYSYFPERLDETPLRRGVIEVKEALPAPIDQEETLSRLLERLGPERPALWRDRTPLSIAHHAPDWRVLKVVVPGLLPLHGDHAFAHLGGARWASSHYADWLNHPPHPFA